MAIELHGEYPTGKRISEKHPPSDVSMVFVSLLEAFVFNSER
jgi:hypothetical protein